MLPTPETYLEYAQRVGAPRAVRCDVVLGSPSSYVYACLSHGYGFNELLPELTYLRQKERCPMSRLEEWRARAFEATGGNAA